jgi:hypothetical protein
VQTGLRDVSQPTKSDLVKPGARGPIEGRRGEGEGPQRGISPRKTSGVARESSGSIGGLPATELLERLPVGIVLLEESTRNVLFSNPAAVTLLGQGALVGESFPFRLSPGKHVLPGSEVGLAGLELDVSRLESRGRKLESMRSQPGARSIPKGWHLRTISPACPT